MLLTALLTCVYILSGTFRGLLTFIGITEYLIFILTVLALFRLRLRPPPPAPSSSPSIKLGSATIYRTNTVNPVVFCVLSVFLVARGVVTEPAQGGAIIAVVVVVWALWLWRGGGVCSGRDSR
jgi:solute carrier family 7 (L-type amino acid transporter), member 6